MKECISKLKQGDIVRFAYGENIKVNLIEAKFIQASGCNHSIVDLHKDVFYTIIDNVNIMSIKKLRAAGGYITNPII